jgi:aldose 1-epimerase
VSAANRKAIATAADGSPVEQVRIEGGGLSATLLTWGALVQDLRLAGHAPPLVLGFAEFEPYLAHSPYFGVTAGRYANRIRDARFAIDGQEYQADRNFLGKHLLHGGAQGTAKRNWRLASAAGDSATFALTDRDGEMGFPGTCELQVTYACRAPGILAIEMTATTDRPTLVNLAHHSYFNLDGTPDTRDHELQISADAYLPVDDELIPTGEERPVAGTDFDFRKLRPIRRETGGEQVVYDHNFCLSRQRVAPRQVAVAQSRRSGVAMTVTTGEPGLQFYAGHKLATPVAGLTGTPYGAFGGFCLEAQVWPDSPHKHFPQAILRPGETYRQVTAYAFSRTK